MTIALQQQDLVTVVMPGIGPKLPPHLQNLAPSTEDEDDEDSYVPELPPHLLASRSSNTSKPPTPNPNPNPTRKIQGPSFPSPADDDSDDDIGPKPLPVSALGSVSVEKDAVQEFMEREENRRRKIEEAKNPSPLKREEWMLIPPSSSDLLGKLDPTKLSKPRQFSRSTAPVRPSSSTDMSLWTETPAERQQRLADEVSGKRRRTTAPEEEVNAEDEEERKRRKVYDEELRKGVEDYTRKYRGPALVESHRSRRKDEDEDSKESKIWEHGRDMGISGRLMDDSKREQMIKESKGLSSRFAGASTGNFL